MKQEIICEGCLRHRTSIKPSKLTSAMLCGSCRIEEWQERHAEAYVDSMTDNRRILQLEADLVGGAE